MLISETFLGVSANSFGSSLDKNKRVLRAEKYFILYFAKVSGQHQAAISFESILRVDSAGRQRREG